jgi:outer membrane protein insertion porin family
VKVAISAEPPKKGQLGRLEIAIDEGKPVTLSRIDILSRGPLSDHDILSGLGVRPGDRLARDVAFQGLERLEKLLSTRGFLNSHLSFYFVLPDGTRQTSYGALAEAKATQAAIAVAVEPGQKALVAVEADPLLGTETLADAITVYKNRSYSPSELDFSADALRARYVAAGYPDAKVSHAIAKEADGSYMITFTVEAGQKVAIDAINFIGNKAFTADQLRRVFQTQPARRFFGGGAFVPEVWDEDLANLLSFYETQGFLDAKVTADDRLLDKNTGKMTLVVHLDEGPRTMISRLLFKGANAAQEAGILQSLVVNPGDPYNPRRLNDYTASVEAYFARTGYPAAQVTAAFEPGATPGQSALVFTVKPGARKRVGDVIMRGNIKTKDWVVRRQITVKSGDLYNAEETLRTQQQIYQLGFFDRVNIAPLRPITADPNDPVDLIVDLHERETGSVAVGGGYGDLQGPQASLEYLQTNVAGTGRPVRLESLFSQRRSSGLLTVRDPYIFGDRNIGEAGASYLRDTPTTGLHVESYGPSLGITRQISDYLLGSIRYNWSNVRYLSPTDELRAQTNGIEKYVNSVVTGGLTFDNRSDILNPHYGTRTDFAVDVATPTFGGTLLYARPRVSWAHFVPFPRQITLALGAEAAYIQPFQNSPLLPDLLFRAGGGSSLRGYTYNTVGANGTALGANGTVPGGQALVVTHGEVRFPVFGDLGGVVFSDAGNVFGSLSEIGLSNVRVSAGLGIRYYTPVGPVRVDYAFRVLPTLDFGFGSGWEFIGRNLYFGIGHAF